VNFEVEAVVVPKAQSLPKCVPVRASQASQRLPIIPLAATLDVTQESYPMVVDSAAILIAVPANSHAMYITWHTANLSKTDARLGAHVIRMPLFSTLLAAVEVMACPLSLSPSVCCCIIAHVQHRNLVSLSCVAMREV
jgi:hypothetical protein